MSNMNFNCDVCGREVQGCTFVNGMKFCAKCYQETFGETEKDRKIADLQSQLAEKDKEIEKLKGIKIIPAPINGEDTKKFLKNLERHYLVISDANEPQVTMLDQNQKAIEQLDKVKEWCENHKFSDEYDYVIAYEPDEEDASGCVDYLKEEIDNQINELKEEV